MRTLVAVIFTLGLAGLSVAQQPVPAPPAPPAKSDIVEVQRVKISVAWTEFKIDTGHTLLMDSQVAATKWMLIDDEVADLLLLENGQKAAFICSKPGVYRIAVSQGGELKRVRITVGEATPPAPPIPVTPPEPPKPVTPPKPADPLASKLKTAFDADKTTPDKSNAVKDLAALYRQGAKLTKQTSIATGADLMKQIHDAASILLNGPDSLKSVRTIVNGELNTIVPITTGQLTDDQRKAAADLFTRVAGILEGF